MNNENLDIKIFSEISDYHGKVYGLTFRQLFFGILTIAIVVPLYIYGKKQIPEELLEWIIILIASPLLVIGFVPIQEMYAEKILPFWKRHYIDFGKPLKYKTNKDVAIEKNQSSSKYIFFEDGTSRKLTKQEKQQRKIELKEIKKQKKQNKSNKKLKEKKKMEVLPTNEKATKKELRKQRKQAKQLAKAKKKFQGKLEVLPPIKNEDNTDTKANILIGTTKKGKGRKLVQKYSVDKSNEKADKNIESNQSINKETQAVNNAMKKFELYEEFKKMKPDATKEDFEVFYSMYEKE